MGAAFRYRDPNPAASEFGKGKVPRDAAREIELELWLALDAVRRGGAPNSQANKVIEHMGAAQALWAVKLEAVRHRQSLHAWGLLCDCSLTPGAATLELTEDAYQAISATLTVYLANLTKFTIRELAWAVTEARRRIAGD